MSDNVVAPTQDSARDALHDVIDPELGFNIVDLGLIYAIAIEDGIIDIRMTMTTPGCPAQEYIVHGVESRLAQEEGVRGVFVDVVWEPPWRPRMMSPEAKAHFGIREDDD